MTEKLISVVICTHNPRPNYLQRCLDSIHKQTLQPESWECLVVDNRSQPTVTSLFDLPPHCRLVYEGQLGLTHARIRGIHETSGQLIVFVDDDNVIAPDYLESAVQICHSRPYIGAFGGNVDGEFEIPPPEFTKGLLGWLAIRSREEDTWGNSFHHCPVGAGLCVRRDVAHKYVTDLENHPERKLLDRTGQDLLSGGDTDLALTAFELGYGIGVFTKLNLLHLIPASRLTRQYFVRLAEAMAFSPALMARMGRFPAFEQPNWRRRLLDWIKLPLSSSFDRALLKARARGISRAAAYRLPGVGEKGDLGK